MNLISFFVISNILTSQALEIESWKNLFLSQNQVVSVHSPLRESIDDEIVGVVTKGNVEDVNFSQDENGNVTLVGGVSVVIWDYIFKYTGLKWKAINAVHQWGGEFDLRRNSLTGALHYDEADVSINSMSHCCGRYKLIDLSDMTTNRDFIVIFRQPDLASEIFSCLFTPMLWKATGVVVILFQLVMLLVIYIHRKHEVFNRLDILSWSLCIISQQGYDKTPIRASGQLTFFIASVFGMLCFAGFSANIVTSLTETKSLNTIEDLINYQPMKIYGSYFEPFWQEVVTSKNEITKKLADRVKDLRKIESVCPYEDPADVPKCDQEIVGYIAAENSVEDKAFVAPSMYITDKSKDGFAFNNDQQAVCRTTSFRVPMGQQGMMYGFRKGFPLKNKINNALLRCKEIGLLKYIANKRIDERPACQDLETNSFKKVEFKYIFGAYVVLAGGIIVAVVIFILELALYRR